MARASQENARSSAGSRCTQHVLAEVQNVVDTCSSCREWQRRSNKPVASLTITSQFNEGVQFDLLFLEDDMIVAHIVCMCIRWAQGEMVKSREPKDVLAAIDHFWIRQYGPPKTIVSDQEGALYSDEGAIWASRWQIELKSKAKGAHAHIIERRNDLLRQQYNKVRSAARKDGLLQSRPSRFLTSLFWRATAYCPSTALLLMRHSSDVCLTLLRDLHSDNAATALDDISGGATSRHIHSLRELSLKTIIQGHANERLRIAANTKTRPAVQTLDLKPGDLVEFYEIPRARM